MPPLTDTFGRQVKKLRISVTDQCNLRCSYCMPPEGLEWLPKAEILTFEEITRLARLFVTHGVTHIRLTGGEPLMRRHLEVLVGQLATLTSVGLGDIGMTTNGILLEEQLPALVSAGLTSVNISLDTIDPETFRLITRRDQMDRVVAGIRTAARLLPGRVKVNAVLQRGLNDDGALDLVLACMEWDVEARFIEKMPLDAQGAWKPDQVISGADVLAMLAPLDPSPSAKPRGASPARLYDLAVATSTDRGDPPRVGLINSVTEPFCQSCDRVRLTADGALRNCLFSTRETDLKTPLRSGASDADLVALIEAEIFAKGPGHLINQQNFTPASRSMSRVGG
ncbi:MAG: GTP 3',8-cyclase MoaA [Planctomycetota bacterium]